MSDMTDFLFGIQDVKIAPWTATNSYGTAYDVVAISQFEASEQTINAELEGDDQVVAVHSKSRVWEVRIQFGFRDLDVYSVITGATLAGASGSADEVAIFDSRSYPYFGMVARIDEVNATGCRHIFLPKCKVMEGFSLGAQFGQFVTPQMTVRAVVDGSRGGMQILNYSTLRAPVLPPI